MTHCKRSPVFSVGYCNNLPKVILLLGLTWKCWRISEIEHCYFVCDSVDPFMGTQLGFLKWVICQAACLLTSCHTAFAAAWTGCLASEGLTVKQGYKSNNKTVFKLWYFGTRLFILPKKDGMAWTEWCEERERRREVREREEIKVPLLLLLLLFLVIIHLMSSSPFFLL